MVRRHVCLSPFLRFTHGRLKANNPYLPKKYNEWEVVYDTVEPEIMP